MSSPQTRLSPEAAQLVYREYLPLGIPLLEANGTGPRKIQGSLESHSPPLLHAVEVVYIPGGMAGIKPLMRLSAPGTWSLPISEPSRSLTACAGLACRVSLLLAWFGNYPPSLSQAHTLSASLCLSFSFSLSTLSVSLFFPSF